MNRRRFMELAGYAAGMSMSCSMAPDKPASLPSKPNFIVIMADDLGWADVGYHDSIIRTPTLDRLSREGVVFDKFYVYPSGTPTRASLMTGRYASRLGVPDNLAITGDPPLAYDQDTCATLLRRAGYATAITGKWQLGNELSSAPGRYGFDHTHGFLGPWIDSYTHRTEGDRATWYRNGEYIEQNGHATDLIADEAVVYIENNTGMRDPEKPFFLHVAFNAPHMPLQAGDSYLHRYRSMFLSDSRRYYAAMVTHMDDAIERIVQSLEKHGYASNTCLIFLSDNGAETQGINMYPYPEPTINTTTDTGLLGSNYPFSSGKHTLYEGGIRIPALMYWPETLIPRKIVDPVAVYDILPTILAQASVRIHPETFIDGTDITPLVTGVQESLQRMHYLRIGTASSVFTEGWKLIHIGASIDDGWDELYFTEQDTAERFNQAVVEPSICDFLKQELIRQHAQDESSRKSYATRRFPG